MPTTLHELQRRAKLGARNQYRVDLCIDFDELETRPCKIKHPSWARNSPYFRLAKDKRSFQDEEGLWHVFPIAVSKSRVFIVCPLCECVHVHGNDSISERLAVLEEKLANIKPEDTTLEAWKKFTDGAVGNLQIQMQDAIERLDAIESSDKDDEDEDEEEEEDT